jgi:hypothetical protein
MTIFGYIFTGISKKHVFTSPQPGDVVAQLAKATGRHQTEDAAVPGSNPAPPQSPERGTGPGYLTVLHI